MIENLIQASWLTIGVAMLHTYVTYPLSLNLFRRKKVTPNERQEWPTVSILVAAHNEEACIKSKVQNCLELDYDSKKLEVIVGSDASTDRTVEIVESIPDTRLRVLTSPERKGKAAVLNLLVENSQGEILVFTDANVIIEKQGLHSIARHFDDGQVGAVSGTKVMTIPMGASETQREVTYSNFENRIKKLESDIGGASGCRGAFMARRRADFVPFREGAICDDMIAAIETINRGKRVLFDPEARAYEDCSETIYSEFKRRIRIGTGNMQVLRWYPGILNPRNGVAAYCLISHKVIRWIFPFLMIGFFCTTILLSSNLIQKYFLYLQLVGYLAAVIGWVFNRLQISVPFFRSIYHFVSMNIALMIGSFRFFFGIQEAAWERTPRTANEGIRNK